MSGMLVFIQTSTLRAACSAAYAVKMAEMYSKIGRTEETLELIDETLDVWKEKAKEGGGFQLGDQRRYKETIGAGFTQQDLDKLGPEELEMVLQLLQTKEMHL